MRNKFFTHFNGSLFHSGLGQKLKRLTLALGAFKVSIMPFYGLVKRIAGTVPVNSSFFGRFAFAWLFVVMIAANGYSQNDLQLEWAKSFDNSVPQGGGIRVQAIKMDDSGNKYVTGFFLNTADFDPGPGTANLIATSDDIFVAKYDASGNLVYAIGMGGTTQDYGLSIAIDGSGNAYITGFFAATVDFDPGVGTANLTSAGERDIFLAKYDASGNYVFAKRFGASYYNDQGNAVAVDADGNAYLTGYFQGTVDFDPGAGTANLTSAGSFDTFLAKYDASGNYVYAKRIGGSSSDEGLSVAIDGNDNAYLSGYYSGTADFDPGPGTANLISVGSYDAFLAKYDATGNYVYAIPLGGTSTDYGNSIALDGSGNPYLAGYFRNTVDFDPGIGTANLISVGDKDIFLAKYDAEGNYVYAIGFGGSSDEQGKSVAIDASGNAYLTGIFKGTADFDPGAGTSNLTSAGDFDIFLAKYNATGDYVYAKRMGATDADYGLSIAIDGSNNTYLAGYFTGTVDFDPGSGTVNLVAGSGNENAFIGKYDASGNYIWAGLLGGYSYAGMSERGVAMVRDSQGNLFIAGIFEGTVDFDPGAGTANLTSAGDEDEDIFLAKYNASGNFVYAKQIGGTEDQRVNSLAIDGSGNLYLIGNFSGTADFDPGAGTANLTSASDFDLFLAKYNASGNYVYAKRIGSTGYRDQIGKSIAVDGSGNAYITGYFDGTTDFDPGAGTANLTTSAGNHDIFLAKYDATGNYVFAKQIGGTSRDEGSSVAVDASGNTYLTGYFQGAADFDPGAGTANLTSAGNYDIFLAKYDALGNYVFADRIGGTQYDISNFIAIDGSGNAYLTGKINGTVDFDPGAGTANLSLNGGFFLAKYDVSGNYVNAKGMSGNGSCYSLAIDGSSNTYLTGYFIDQLDFDPGPGTATLTSAGSADIFVAKYDASGNYVYAKKMGGLSYDDGWSVAIDGTGNVYITGRFTGTADFDPGVTTNNLTSLNWENCYIGAYSEFLACTNPTNGGEIAESQAICGGDDPVAFTSTSDPTGHLGTLEYKWQSSTTSAIAGFSDIASSNAATYTPGALTQTTWFKRLARVDCQTDWTGAAESNTIEITVLPDFHSGSITSAGETIACGGTPSLIGSVSDWEFVGVPGFSADEAAYTSLALDGNNTPYVAYRDGEYNGKATVKKFNGTSWEPVGTEGFSAGDVQDISLALDGNGIPYVAYIDVENEYKATVMKFNGTNWETVGTAGFSTGMADYTSLAFDGTGTPYLAYTDIMTGIKVNVMKFNGTSWINVGAAGLSAGAAHYTSLAFDPIGTPYVAYVDQWYAGKITVKRFNGTNWESVGAEGFGSIITQFLSIKIDESGNPFVAFRDSNIGDKASVMKFNGTNWETVGAPGLSAGVASFISLALNGSGTPYVAYTDGNKTDDATVMKFNGSNWETVGTAGFTEGDASSFSLAIDTNGTPYLAFVDDEAGDGATVMKFISGDASGGDGNYTYEWRSSADNYASVIAGATAASYTPPAGLTSTTSYRRFVHDGTCQTTFVQSQNTWTVTVEPCCTNPTDGGEISAAQTICSGASPETLQSEELPTGHTGDLEYKWQSSTTSGTAGFTDIASSNTTTYSPGAIIQNTWFKRLARVDCEADWTGAAESNVIEIAIESTPVSGTLAKTPDAANVCESDDVSATLTAGSGGNGTDELEYRTHDGSNWSGWAAYTSGNDISTTGFTQVEIRTRRMANCSDNAAYNSVYWQVEQTPVSGTLTKTPDADNVCENEDVSAILTAGSGGNGTDELEYRTHDGTNWSAWANYVSGNDISTTGKTDVEIRTRRMADYCSDAGYSTINWTVDPTTVAGILDGDDETDYGSSTGNLTLTGYTGNVVKWQKRTGTSGPWTDISHTSDVFSESPASAGTWQYTAVVQSGTCSEEQAEPHTVTVNPKELTIGGSFTANDKIYDDNTNATFDQNDLELLGVVGSDDVSLTGLEIDFAAKTVGNHTVSITAASLAGVNKDNYTLSLDGAPETTADINPGPPAKFLITETDGSDISSPKLQNIPFDVKVTLVDAFDNPTPNTGGDAAVTLTGSGGAVAGVLLVLGAIGDPVELTLAEDESSIGFTNILYSGLSALAGFDVKISASAAGTGSASGNTGESALFSVRGIKLTVTADEETLPADGASETLVTVLLTNAQVPPQPLAGQQITLSADFGTLFDITDPGNPVAVVGSKVFNTDANGEVKVSLQAAATSGVATVLALCPGACPAEAEVAFLLSAPAITGFTPGEESVEVDFDSPANEGADAITNYEYSLDEGATWTAFAPEQATSPVTISDLTGGVSYQLQLRAINGAGSGEASDNFEVYPCFNPTDGGEIADDQLLEYNTVPAELTSVEAATGHFGTLEYQWQKSTRSAVADFEDITGANEAEYQPGAITQNTWFRRLARAGCKPDWSTAVASNVVFIQVDYVQEVQIPQGWSYISSYLQPNNPNIVNMFADIVGANNLGILTGVQGIYAPAPFYINTLQNWDVLKGYKVKMAAQDQLIVTGDTLTDKTVTFPAGVHLIPVLTNQVTPLDEVIENPATDLLYMLDIYSNQVYWPGGGINTLTELVPGKGYLANFQNPVTLTYPPMDFDKKKSSTVSEFAIGPWPCNRTSNYHLISISADAVKDLQNADYIGAFDSQGNCVGYAALEKTGENILLTVYGDEPITAENDGLMEGELLRFRSFSLGDNAEKELTATFNPTFPNADGLFAINGLSGISGFKESATGVGENELAASVQVYPNPAKDVLNITLTGFKTLSGLEKGLTATLLTTEGKVVKTYPITSPITQMDVSGLQTGIYLLKIETTDQIVVKRVVKQ